MINIADIYDNQSDYEKKDEKQTIMWLTKAAKQGNVHAQTQLNKSYRTGWGVDRNLTQAMSVIREAVEQNYDKAKEEFNHLEENIRNKRVSSMGRTEVFISYSGKDKKYVDEMQPFLNVLYRNHKIKSWCYEMINAGDKWKEAIHQHMATARVAVLMVSQNFLDSSFILEVELPELLQAAEDEHATILWIPVSDAQVKDTLITSKNGDKICIVDYQAVGGSLKPLQNMVKKAERLKLYNKLCEAIKYCFMVS